MQSKAAAPRHNVGEGLITCSPITQFREPFLQLLSWKVTQVTWQDTPRHQCDFTVLHRKLFSAELFPLSRHISYKN